MSFRFRMTTRLGPLRFNFAKSGLSSISLGGRGASFNIPVARPGRARSQDDAKRRAHRCIEAVREATRLSAARGWLVP